MDPRDEDYVLNTDELLQQMSADEKPLAEIGLATPRDYARLRPDLVDSAQLVYYYIRTGKLIPQTCNCGRRVISIEAADELFTGLLKKRQAKVKGN